MTHPLMLPHTGMRDVMHSKKHMRLFSRVLCRDLLSVYLLAHAVSCMLVTSTSVVPYTANGCICCNHNDMMSEITILRVKSKVSFHACTLKRTRKNRKQ